MKKKLSILMAGLLFLFTANAFADIQISQNGTREGQYRKINLKNGVTVAANGDIAFDALSVTTPTITGGTIDGAVIGGVTPAAGTFTTLRGTSGPAIVSTLTTNAVDAAHAVWAESDALVFEGTTADGFEGRVTSSDWTADRTHTLPDMTGAFLMSTLATNNLDAANSIWCESNNLAFEGATADAFETRITPTDPTADRTVTLPDASGTVALYATTALTPGSTVTWTPGSGTAFTLVPAQAETINMVSTGATSGQEVNLVITTSGTSSFTLTFNTNFKSNGTLETGTVSGVIYTVSFVFDGTNWNEVARVRDGVPSFALVDAATIALGTAEGLNTYTYTPAQTNTINAAVVRKAGSEFSIIYLTSGGSSFTTTFGTNFKTTATLASGTSTGKYFIIHFISDGTNWIETSRTAAI